MDKRRLVLWVIMLSISYYLIFVYKPPFHMVNGNARYNLTVQGSIINYTINISTVTCYYRLGNWSSEYLLSQVNNASIKSRALNLTSLYVGCLRYFAG